MTILVIADLHSQRKILPPLASTIHRLKPAAVFGLGDLTINGPSAAPYTEQLIEVAHSPDHPLICISGNNDDPDSLAILKTAGCLYDFAETRVGDLRVVGIGYGEPAAPFLPDLANAVLLSHLPPRRNSQPPPLHNAPRFHFAGHLHRFARCWLLGTTTVVQVPTAMELRAAVFYPKEKQVDFITLREQNEA